MGATINAQIFESGFVRTGGPQGPDPFIRVIEKLRKIWKGVTRLFVRISATAKKGLLAIKRSLNSGAEVHNRMMALKDERYRNNYYHIRMF